MTLSLTDIVVVVWSFSLLSISILFGFSDTAAVRCAAGGGFGRAKYFVGCFSVVILLFVVHLVFDRSLSEIHCICIVSACQCQLFQRRCHYLCIATDCYGMQFFERDSDCENPVCAMSKLF